MTYAALFCAFLLLCWGVKISFSSLLLLAPAPSSREASFVGMETLIMSTSGIEIIESGRTLLEGD